MYFPKVSLSILSGSPGSKPIVNLINYNFYITNHTFFSKVYFNWLYMLLLLFKANKRLIKKSDAAAHRLYIFIVIVSIIFGNGV